MNFVSSSGLTIAKCTTPKQIIHLLCEFEREQGGLDRFGTFSTAIYDTAWLSMVHRNIEGHVFWCFPESFEYLLQYQRDDGMWDTYASPIDGLLNTLAGLLSLLTRRELCPETPTEGNSLSWRIQKAQAGLQSLLQSWKVDETVHVGFEILVPGLLGQIERFGIAFEFPGQQRLSQLNAAKMAKFKPELVYSERQTTLLHSLEALVELIDFDNVSHHCSEESGMLGSPASTAAYLLHCSTWDERAEMYLRNTIHINGDCGGVPSAYPTSLFEISWALSTLLPRAISTRDLEVEEVNRLCLFLAKAIESRGGVVGFAPGILEDADDTARVILALQLLGKDVHLNQMIQIFQSDVCFRTYEMEQHPSFSANCNVLLAMLGSNSVDEYTTKIEKVLHFLFAKWENDDVFDKWNLAPQYSSMLFSAVLLRLLETWDTGHLQQLPSNLIEQQLPVALCRVLSRTLHQQRVDGSWASSIEVTAYSILTVVQCLCLPWDTELRQSLIECVSHGRNFILSRQQNDLGTDYLWIEKVTFGTHFLQRVYCLSAVYASCDENIWSEKTTKHFSMSEAISRKLRHLFLKLPLFEQSCLVSMELAFVEAVRLSTYLQEERFAVFPRDTMPMTKDKYLQYIPLIWTACNQKGGHLLSSEILRSMVSLSLLNYQIDEYMESVVVHLDEPSLQLLVSAIADECQLGINLGRNYKPQLLNHISSPKEDGTIKDAALEPESKRRRTVVSPESIVGVITKYIRYILQHPAVLRAATSAQRDLAIEVHSFLLAHIDHNFHNVRLKAQRKSSGGRTGGYASPGLTQSSYLKWVRSAGADDTSCPFSFQFFVCLIGASECLEGALAKYLSQSLARHLATMCRQYNDYGSAARDADEGNLNSLDFAEFHRSRRDATEKTARTNGELSGANGNGVNKIASMYPTQTMKGELMEIAEFERASMQLTLQSLGETLRSPVIMKSFQVFIDTTDAFGQIYVQKDIASRIRPGSH